MESYDYAPAGQAVLVEGLGGFRRSQGRLSFKHPFPGQRLFAFDEHSNDWDVEALRRKLAEFDKATRWLKAFSQVFFIVLFVVMPTLYVRLESQPHNFLAGLAAALILWWGSSTALYYADRRLNKAAGIHRVQRLLHAMIAPGFALRGTEALSRDLLKAWHPLAAAAALMKPEDFKALCQSAWLDEQFRAEARLRLGEVWLFGSLAPEKRESWLTKQQIDPKDLQSPPKRNQDDSQSYCPRCLAQFTIKEGLCSDCALPLKLL